MFMIDSGVRQVCIMFPCLRNVYMDIVFMKEVKMEIGRRGMRYQEEGRGEIAWPLACT